MSINFENISLLVSVSMELLANKKYAQVAWTYLHCHFVLRLHGPIWSCFVLRLHRPIRFHFVLRPHGPIWLSFCAQVAWTYMIVILCSGCTDLYDQCYDLHFVLRSHGPILHVWTHSTEGLWICHFALSPHRPIWLPFCNQVTWAYMIGVLHSGCTDLLYIYSTLKYYNAALCHPHLPFIPTMYTSTIL